MISRDTVSAAPTPVVSAPRTPNTAPASFLRHIPTPPHVRIRCLLAEADRQEINRRASYRLAEIAKLKGAIRQYKLTVARMAAERRCRGLSVPTSDVSIISFGEANANSFSNMTLNHQDEVSADDGQCADDRYSTEKPLMDDTSLSSASAAATPDRMKSASMINLPPANISPPRFHPSISAVFTSFSGASSEDNASSLPPPIQNLHPSIALVSAPCEEELALEKKIIDANTLIQHHRQLMSFETDDVAQSYAELMLECDATIRRVTTEGEFLGAVNIDSELQNFATHVVMLHAALFPWQNGVLLETNIRCEQGHPLYDRGSLADGRAGGMLILSFSAANHVSAARQFLSNTKKRRIMEEANRKLQAFKQRMQKRGETAIGEKGRMSSL